MAELKETDKSSWSNLKDKHILVTGGVGYIGSHTVVQLIEQGALVTIVDNLVNSNKVSLERVEEITKVRPDFHQVDLCDEGALEKVFADYASRNKMFDAVIHFAGLKAVGESVSIPLRYYENNITGSIVLFKLMDKYNCRKMVFSSSATVYGLPSQNPVPETESLKPTNPYGQTKFMIEEMMRDLSNPLSKSKWKFVLLRYFNPVGAHPSGIIGEDPSGIPNNLTPYVTQVAIGRHPHVNVFGNDWDTPDGTGVRDYIHVMDLAAGHLASLSMAVFGDAQEKDCDVYNLGTGNGFSVMDVIAAVEKASGKQVPYKIAPRRPGDIGTCLADPSKANQVLKWRANLNIEQQVADAWRWQKQYPNGYKDKL